MIFELIGPANLDIQPDTVIAAKGDGRQGPEIVDRVLMDLPASPVKHPYESRPIAALSREPGPEHLHYGEGAVDHHGRRPVGSYPAFPLARNDMAAEV